MDCHSTTGLVGISLKEVSQYHVVKINQSITHAPSYSGNLFLLLALGLFFWTVTLPLVYPVNFCCVVLHYCFEGTKKRK